MTSSEYFTVGCASRDTGYALLGRESPTLDLRPQRRVARVRVVEVIEGDGLAPRNRLREGLTADELPARQLPVQKRDGEEHVLVAEPVPGGEVGGGIHTPDECVEVLDLGARRTALARTGSPAHLLGLGE